ncbi:MAG: exodeoxyribonuclease VII small subunit [Planctomycetota bacterium]
MSARPNPKDTKRAGGAPEGADTAAPVEAFDARLARLETLVAELEGGGLGLEAAIERYRDGVALLKGCRDTLGALQKQVEELGQDAVGGARPYAGDPDLGAQA